MTSESMRIGNHILGIYDTKKEKFDSAFPFLKDGLENNEVVMIVTDDMTKDDIRSRMEREWRLDIRELEAAGEVIIKDTREWYYPNGKVDSSRILALWYALSELATVKGKRGLRIFGDVDGFFNHGFGRDLVKYEEQLDKKFDIPVTAICAYERNAIERHVSRSDLELLKLHHHHVRARSPT